MASRTLLSLVSLLSLAGFIIPALAQNTTFNGSTGCLGNDSMWQFTTTIISTELITTTHFTTSLVPVTDEKGRPPTAVTVTTTVEKTNEAVSVTITKSETVTVTVKSTTNCGYTTVAPRTQRRMERSGESNIGFNWDDHRFSGSISLEEPIEDLDFMAWQITAKPSKGVGEDFYKYPNQYRKNIVQRDKGDDMMAGGHMCLTKKTDKSINREVLEEYVEMIGRFNGSWWIKPEACHRLGCRQNTGIWWCNDNAEDGDTATVGSLDLIQMSFRVLDSCVKNGFPGWQYFAGDHPRGARTKIVMSYANCDDSPSKRHGPFEYEDQKEPWS
ncbi:hypothetical protein B0T21DRAFT_348828 [Apiosordaria backusii]|uniref:Uncharacterized protein n=1 Tax=Apiosordaria backusii TaxID=314023 RepID=A0AA40ECV2_9PEZI|nr:hypothetical protein B0T21DRAFT_348828 [Apiosordaria backusii]